MLKISCVAGAGPPRLIFEGEISAALVEHAFDALIAEPGFDGGAGLVVDATRQVVEYSHDEIRDLARHMAAKRQSFGGHLALVVSADSHMQFGLARVYAAYAENQGLAVGIFTTTKDAVCWIGASSAV